MTKRNRHISGIVVRCTNDASERSPTATLLGAARALGRDARALLRPLPRPAPGRRAEPALNRRTTRSGLDQQWFRSPKSLTRRPRMYNNESQNGKPIRSEGLPRSPVTTRTG